MCLLETQACIEYKNHLWKEKRKNKKRSPKKDKLLQFSFEVGYYSWNFSMSYMGKEEWVIVHLTDELRPCKYAGWKVQSKMQLCFRVVFSSTQLIQISSILLFPLSIKQMSAGSICVSLISMYSTHLKLESCLILIQLIF